MMAIVFAAGAGCATTGEYNATSTSKRSDERSSAVAVSAADYGSSPAATSPSAASAPAAATRATTAAPLRASANPARVRIASAPQNTVDYTATLNVYRAKGYYYQFVNCSGNPGYFSVKKGVPFMLDNRSDRAHTFTVGGVDYPTPAYGFAVVTASTLGQYNILCDGGGAASLNVEL